jgi:hypothetical protein
VSCISPLYESARIQRGLWALSASARRGHEGEDFDVYKEEGLEQAERERQVNMG